MALHLNEIEEALDWRDEWPLPARPQFLRSQTLDTFERELRRYVDEQIPGRSFLISGHRGIGKTALANRAVDNVARTIIRDLTDPNVPTTNTMRPISLQRPLLVKIHGPSLLSGELSKPGGGEQPKTTAALTKLSDEQPNPTVGGALEPPRPGGAGSRRARSFCPAAPRPGRFEGSTNGRIRLFIA